MTALKLAGMDLITGRCMVHSVYADAVARKREDVKKDVLL